MSATATTDPQLLRERLDLLGELEVLQGCNPDADIFTAEMEDEANRIGVELLEIEADEAEAMKASVPPSPEVETHAHWKRCDATEAREQLPSFRRTIAMDKPLILLGPMPPAKVKGNGKPTARESHGSSSRTQGSRRGSSSASRSSSSGDPDLSDSDEPGEAGQQDRTECAREGCADVAPVYSGRGRKPIYCVGAECAKARAVERQRQSRARTTTLSPAVVCLVDEVGERVIPISPKGISFSEESARTFEGEDAHHVARRAERVVSQWDEGGKGYSIVGIVEPHRGGAAAGALWLDGEHAKAEAQAEQATRDAMVLAEEAKDSGQMWDGLGTRLMSDVVTEVPKAGPWVKYPAEAAAPVVDFAALRVDDLAGLHSAFPEEFAAAWERWAA